MSEAVQELLPKLFALPADARALIVAMMTESLPDDDEDDPEFLAMLNRRWDDIISGRVQTQPVERMMERLREKYR